MDYIQISIETTTEAVEAISNLLVEKGVGGVEIEDPKDILFHPKGETSWDYVDDSLVKGDKDVVIIKAYFPEDINQDELISDIQSKLEDIKKYLDIGKGMVSANKIEQISWANEWKKYYKTLRLGKGIIIKPTWEEYKDTIDEEIIIEMDPGMAFGTGTHETTSMCAELIEELIKDQDKVLDIGTGSGILSIVAAKLGASKVTSVDLDKTAVKVARENIKTNNCDDIITVKHGDLLEVVSDKYDIVVANIIADVIIPLSKTVEQVMLDDGIFISSGIIDSRIDDVIDALEQNFEIIEVRRQGEWAAIVSKIKR